MLTKAVYTVRKNCWSGHPWIYSSEVRRVESEAQLVGSEPLCKDQIPGELVRVYDRNRFIGSGMFNPHSLIAVRLYSERDEELNEDLITARIEAAYRYRQKRLPGEEDFRLVYGESDRLPGLVIDKYGSHFAVQVYAAGFDNRLDMVVNSLCRLFAVRSIFEKDDIKLREPEGLKRRERLLYGTPEREILISENGVKFYVDIVSGQKTGYFFDHRLTRRKVRKLAKNRRVLDVFCYTGSFAINAALGEAKEVKAIDISPDACARARDNAVLNQVEDVCEFVCADAFEFMALLIKKGERFDLINLDPPAFIKSQRQKKSGSKGFIKINRMAMRLLSRGGILVSSSCSHYFFWQDLLDCISNAAQEVGRTFVILDRSTQGPDHPVIPQMPETEYLRCLIVQMD